MKVNYSATKLLPVLRNYGCRSNMPHDLHPLFENSRMKVEICHLCGKKIRFAKGYLDRTDNRAYLEAHSRNFAQPAGRTNRLYQKIHNPANCIIRI